MLCAVFVEFEVLTGYMYYDKHRIRFFNPRAEGQRPLDEQILRDQFISGLQDGILMRQVRAKTMEGPGLSFIDVRSYAIKWELQETNMRKPAPHVEAAVASAEPQHALTDLTKMIKKLLPVRLSRWRMSHNNDLTSPS
ncbi:hypothetical protein ACOMHN_049434 [Nucella lapillus]